MCIVYSQSIRFCVATVYCFGSLCLKKKLVTANVCLYQEVVIGNQVFVCYTDANPGDAHMLAGPAVVIDL